ncbi:hypothetical protein [Leucobacter soli]|uniref:Uncharacterized protein n=1 Tax=Leucobacter soli TaxID=2812850 RepID=A0A916JTS4_9MICO|nr:hypothetical protein LEUCIP111803_00555 [Leucobacter soli]
MQTAPMYSSTFILETTNLTDEFHISEVQSVYGNPVLGLEHRPEPEHS